MARINGGPWYGSLDKLARSVVWSLVVVRMAIEQRPIDSYIYISNY